MITQDLTRVTRKKRNMLQLGLDNWSSFSNRPRQSVRHGAEPVVVIKVYAED